MKMKNDDPAMQKTLLALIALLEGDRTEQEQLELVMTALAILIDVFRGLVGNMPAVSFLTRSIRAINAGKKPRFTVEEVKEVA